jgi:luciferase family oxidoreductase group 1
MTPLSILELARITEESDARGALDNARDLAVHAENWGYRRIWVAEHHNMPGIASAATSIVIAHIAAGSKCIRVGAGGIMLPNHAPFVIAEQFGTLARLYPGRIDLGLGRAPGTDPVTSYALRARQDPRAGDEFLERFQELLLLENGGFPQGHPFRNVRAMPADVALPPIWLLGSSGYSAELAAAFGLGFAFAHHFADYDAASAMLGYRERFKPSATLARPYAIVATAAVVADNDAEAERIAASAALHYVRRAKGEYLPLESPEVAAAYPYTPIDRERMARQRARLAVGSATAVKDRLVALAAATRADEIMITSMVYDHAARRHSYELLAEVFALPR